MKKKALLISTAIVLVLAIAIGGTLMLFTAQSGTATNVVTLGKLTLEFYEDVDGAGTGDDKDATTDNATQNYGVIVPNQPLAKEPYVVLKAGSADAYVRVKATLSVKDKNGNSVALNGTGTDADLIWLVNKLFSDGTALKDDWKLVADTADPYDGYYYYVGDGDTLATLTAETADTKKTVFEYTKIPDFTALADLEKFAEFEGYSVSLVLQAQAIQADWNDAADDVTDDSSTWSAVFAQLATTYAPPSPTQP